MTFYEFLEALQKENLVKIINDLDSSLLESLSGFLEDFLKTYFYIGGMPEAVNCYIETQNLNDVRKVQNEIVSNYKNDFSRHITPNDIP